jgi:hypothetical protein
MADLIRLKVPVPARGLTSLEPASEKFPQDAASALVNLRPTLKATWLTRKGSDLFTTLAGSGITPLLSSFYRSTGARTRLAARTGQLYDLLVGTNSSFQTVTDGATDGIDAAALNTAPKNDAYTGVQAKDLFYISDRLHVLGKYDPTDRKLYEVKQPVAPSAALTVRPMTYRILEGWTGNGGVAPYGWTDTAEVDLVAAANIELPVPGNYVRFDVATSGAKGDKVVENVAGEKIESNTIAWAFESTTKQPLLAFEIGLTGAGEYSLVMDPPDKNRPYLVFFEVGNISSISFKQFRCVRNPSVAQKLYQSALLLPGRLQGKYRWVYTHKNPVTKSESKPSDAGNSDGFYDFSAVGTNYKTTDQQALRKSAGLIFTSDSGSDATTTKMVLYRQGGDTPSLFKDSRGIDRYFRVAEIDDFASAINEPSVAPVAGDTNFDVDSIGAHSTTAAGFAVGQWVVVNPTGANEEFILLSTVAGTTLTFATTPLKNAHADNEVVAVAFVDNVGNSSLDLSRTLEAERDDPPAGIRWLSKAPDGRLVACGWVADPMGLAWSNKPTIERPLDHEVFPDVNALTRGSLIQGWRDTLQGTSPGDEIIWGGYFQGLLTVMTRRGLFQVNAYSQADWGPSAMTQILKRGCIAGETVCEVNGQLLWVADGPVVMAWDGQSQPREVSFGRITGDLEAAPSTYYENWFARPWSDESGIYYRLWHTPEGATTNVGHWLYSLTADAWMKDDWNDSTGALRAWTNAMVQSGAADHFELYGVDGSGNVLRLETTDDDDGVEISVRADSARFALPMVCRVEGFYVRMEREVSVCDIGTFHVLAGGSEYGEAEYCVQIELSTVKGGDVEYWLRCPYELLIGRWFEFSLRSDFLNRPEIREVEFVLRPIRMDRVSG